MAGSKRLKALAPPGEEYEWPYNGLTLRQEMFCQIYALTQSTGQSYQMAFNFYAHPEAKRKAYIRGWGLLRRPEIAQRISKMMVNSPMRVALEQHLKELAELRDGAKEDGKWSAAVQAEFLRGKVSGLYIETPQDSGRDNQKDPQEMSIDELDRRIRELQAEGTGNSDGAQAPLGIEDKSGDVCGVHDEFGPGETSPSYLPETPGRDQW